MTKSSSSNHSFYFLGLFIVLGIIKYNTGINFTIFFYQNENLINLICLFFILSIGISHGSLDHIKGKKLLKFYKLEKIFVFYLSYVLISLLIIFFWSLFPAFTLLIFLIIASYHFGKEDSVKFEPAVFKGVSKKFFKPNYNFLSFTLKGSMIIIFPLCFHFRETIEIFELLWVNNEYFKNSLSYINKNDFIGITILLTPVIANYFMVRDGDDFAFMYMELISVLALNVIFTPLIAFTIYFCFLHSVRHSASLIHELNKKDFKKGFQIFIKKALPLTLVTAVLFILSVYVLTNYYVLNDAILKVIFIGLASLTFPHILLEYLLEKNEKQRN